MLNDFTEERNARNAERQLDFELKQLQKLTSEDSQDNQEMIEEKEDQIKNLETILVNKGALSPPCEECNACNNEKEVCQCFCGLCQEVFIRKCLAIRMDKCLNTFRGGIF